MIYTLTLNPSLDMYIPLQKFKIGTENTANVYSIYPGGKGINVSQVLYNLGTKTVAWGLAGGFTGEELISALNSRKIANDFVRIKDQTRINIKLQIQAETAINFTGPHVSNSEINALFARLDDLESDDWVVLSGSLAKNLSNDFYYQFAEDIREHGAHFIVDAVGLPLLNALSAKPFIIKPNEKELQQTLNRSMTTLPDFIKGGQELLQQGAENVIVSLGKKGALLLNKTEVYFAPAALGIAINTVGAGDSMLAGFMSNYLKTHDVLAGFREAVAAGCAAAFSHGLPVKSQIETLLPQIKLQKLQ
jgi:1-phosphofructokinase